MVKAIVGANWGDEGKGKLTDMLASQSDIVVRFQGGANAGHTIINDYGRFALHTLPSGVFYPHITNVVGNGVALDIAKLVQELEELNQEGQAVLLPLGDTLGRYEEARQREALSAARRRLEELAGRMEEDSRRLGRVYQVLGLSGGAFLVILLL